MRLRGTFEATLEVIPSTVNVGLVVLGAHRVDAGELTVGQLSGFIYMFTLLVFPLRLIGFALSELPHSLAGWNRVRDRARRADRTGSRALRSARPRPATGSSSTT